MSSRPENGSAGGPNELTGRSLLLLWGWIAVKVLLLLVLARQQIATFIYGGF
jgi:hypothetical protein